MREDAPAGTVLVGVPRKCLLGVGQVERSPLLEVYMRIGAVGAGDGEPPRELGLWLEMIVGRYDPSHPQHVYLRSLPSGAEVTSFPEASRSLFEGTNLGHAAASADVEVSRAADALRRLIPLVPVLAGADKATPLDCAAEIRWARGAYISRRFPGRFALWGDAPGEPQYGGRMGSLLPGLDIINHRHGEVVKVECSTEVDGMVTYTAVHDVKAGCEIFHNYGASSNEELLFAHGFAVPDNPDDEYLISLGGAAAAGGPHRLSLRDGVPTSLLLAISGGEVSEDGGPVVGEDDLRGLESHLRDRRKRLKKRLEDVEAAEGVEVPIHRTFAEWYIQGMIRVLDFCIKELKEMRG